MQLIESNVYEMKLKFIKADDSLRIMTERRDMLYL